MSDSTSNYIVHSYQSGQWTERRDVLTVEEPLEIIVSTGSPKPTGSKVIAITMRTPGHDAELASGFLFSEGLLEEKSQIHKIFRPENHNSKNSITLSVDEKTFQKIKDSASLDRYTFVNSSCGLCGRTSIESLKEKGFKRINSDRKVSSQTILNLPEKLKPAQHVFNQTGGLHATGLFTSTGELICLMEDVGRHNATDKIIGYAFQENLIPLKENILLVSGRLSYEIVQKAISAQIPLIAAVSAPSDLAIKVGYEFGVTLIGFLRGDGYNVYTHEERIQK
jgi:FdhD protein